MKKYEIIITEPFEIELKNIVYYIAYRFNEPLIAKRKRNKIMSNVYKLDIFPERCPKVFDDNPNMRKLIFDNYIVIYEIKKDTRSNLYNTYISFKTKLFK